MVPGQSQEPQQQPARSCAERRPQMPAVSPEPRLPQPDLSAEACVSAPHPAQATVSHLSSSLSWSRSLTCLTWRICAKESLQQQL